MTYIILFLGFVLILNLIYRGFYFVCDDISRVSFLLFVPWVRYRGCIFRTTYIARLCEYSISCIITDS